MRGLIRERLRMLRFSNGRIVGELLTTEVLLTTEILNW